MIVAVGLAVKAPAEIEARLLSGSRPALHNLVSLETRQMRGRATSKTVPFYLLAFLILTTGCAVSGCARLRRKPAPHVYEASLTEVRLLDTSCLRGRRIVLDPGHGGTFPGAIGRGGLKEADVNLGVALYLWGLLRDAGAEVLLTRSSDRDFLYGETASLRDDLSARVEEALAFKPELFVSLHHNADIFRSEERNQIETYFKMLDDGPSRDVARLVHEHLIRGLGISKGEVVPGNYYVLRNMPCSAVLGEPSYLTNPWVEEKLRLAEKQLLEAQAYFLGILDYFSRGVPQIASLSPCDSVLTDPRPALAAVLSSERSAVDTSSVSLKLDGVPVARSLEDNGRLAKAWPLEPLAGGRHELCASFLNLNGNSSGERCCHFEVSLPPFSLTTSGTPDCCPDKGGVLVTAELEDENGNTVADGTLVTFSGQNGAFSAESVETRGGAATSVFFPDASTEERLVEVYYRNPRDSRILADSLTLRSCRAARHVTTQALSLVADDTGEPLWKAELRSGSTDSLLAVSNSQGLMVFAEDPNGGAILTREGFIPVRVPVLVTVTMASDRDSGPGPSWDSAAGRITPVGTGNLVTIRMRPAASGLLRNARIVVDIERSLESEEGPQGEQRAGDAKEMQGRAGALIRDVGLSLEKMLRGGGAMVLALDESVPDPEKVRRAEIFGSQIYLRIELSSQRSASLLYYPGSSAGKKLAQEIARSWRETVSGKEPPAREGAQYVLRQTSCPAIITMLPASLEYSDDRPFSAIAYALFLGILEDVGLRRDQLVELTVKVAARVQNETLEIVLDDSVSLQALAGQNVTFLCEEGLHLVTVLSGGEKRALKFVSVKKGEQTKLDFDLN